MTGAPNLLAAVWMMWWTVADINIDALCDGSILSLGLTSADLGIVVIGLVIILLVELYQEKGGSVCVWLDNQSCGLQITYIIISLLVIYWLGFLYNEQAAHTFIYQQF